MESEDVEAGMEESGSCALVCLILNETAYIANVGDSRAVLSMNKGKEIIQITTDHKPNNPIEQRRILANGGKIYR